MVSSKLMLPVAALSAAGLLAACGGGWSSNGSQATTAPGSSPSVLAAESNSAAAGDIPDNQVFLDFTNTAAGYSMQYPEGWAQQGSGSDVTFRDKNNVVHVVVSSGALPSVTEVTAELAALKAGSPSLSVEAPTELTLNGAKAIKVVYSTESAPNPVTGKRVTLVVDRYYLAAGGKLAVVDLGTPQGVDNVDAYRQMIESFRWT
jgi:hypothetical protein